LAITGGWTKRRAVGSRLSSRVAKAGLACPDGKWSEELDCLEVEKPRIGFIYAAIEGFPSTRFHRHCGQALRTGVLFLTEFPDFSEVFQINGNGLFPMPDGKAALFQTFR
jgi:hypothetical protein